MRLDDVGEAGQKRLTNASVLVIGAGGLGSPALQHLAGSGVGSLGIVEYDQVDLSNLHRQTLYTTKDVGRPKVDAALARLSAVNPLVDIKVHPFKLDASNATQLFEDYDLVLDGSDTFSTRYVVNEASVRTRTPNVFASVSQFSGQASVFGTEDGPCYRCLFPAPPPAGLIPNCDEGGVLGVVPALLGTIQATEALKLILGIGTSLVGRLLLVDALDLTTREIAIERDPGCRACGSGERLVDERPVEEVTAARLREELASSSPPHLLDVRTDAERVEGHIGGRSIPIEQLRDRLGEADDLLGQDVVVYCASGVRSERAVRELVARGHSARSLQGGMHSWNRT